MKKNYDKIHYIKLFGGKKQSLSVPFILNPNFHQTILIKLYFDAYFRLEEPYRDSSLLGKGKSV